MTITPARLTAVVLCAAVFLAGCQELTNTKSADEAEVALGPDGPRVEVRDVERPDIFSVTDKGLWDGRPSLGGVWVAHPDVGDPERAKITNTGNGQTVSGALFRRERANPGPRIQVSSDAAAALGMLAGQPADLSIVVVRQEKIELEPEPLPLSDEDNQAGTVEEEADADDGSDSAAATVAVAGATVAAEVADQPQRQGFWAKFRESLRNKPEADAGELEAAAESAAVPEVETAPLDPVTTVAAAAIAEAELSEERPAPRASAPSSVRNPYIQDGLFSVEENASAAAASLRKAGIVPEIRGQQSGDATLWRVFVGPISTTDDQAALLGQIKQLGYKDAFLSPN
jgi:cell division septation protein DedD